MAKASGIVEQARDDAWSKGLSSNDQEAFVETVRDRAAHSLEQWERLPDTPNQHRGEDRGRDERRPTSAVPRPGPAPRNAGLLTTPLTSSQLMVLVI
jgi:hypothetical protein